MVLRFPCIVSGGGSAGGGAAARGRLLGEAGAPPARLDSLAAPCRCMAGDWGSVTVRDYVNSRRCGARGAGEPPPLGNPGVNGPALGPEADPLAARGSRA
jgi:hypothetical protein